MIFLCKALLLLFIYLLLLISEVKLYASLNSFYFVLKLQLKLVYRQSRLLFFKIQVVLLTPLRLHACPFSTLAHFA